MSQPGPFCAGANRSVDELESGGSSGGQDHLHAEGRAWGKHHQRASNGVLSVVNRCLYVFPIMIVRILQYWELIFLLAQADFSRRIAKKLKVQTNRHALETDTHLRLNGTPLGDVYAIGDCATVQNNVAEHLVSFLRRLAWQKGQNPEDVQLTFSDWREVAGQVKKRFPQASHHLRRLDRLFNEYDKDKSGSLDFQELSSLLRQIDDKLTSLPATAQRAHQQGQYLGRKFTKISLAAPGLRLNEVDYGDLDEAIYKAFQYKHLGSVAYVGNAAVFDFGGMSFSGGLLAVYIWRSIYFAQSVSLRTRILLAMDWTKRALFGRGWSSFPLPHFFYGRHEVYE